MFDRLLLTQTEISSYLKDANVVGATVDNANRTVTVLLDEGAPSVMWNLSQMFNDYVEKVVGYGLSQEDFTSLLKDKLDNIADEANKNVQSDWDIVDTTSDAYIKHKPAQHTHDNKDVLDKFSDNGSGLQYDGTAIEDLFTLDISINPDYGLVGGVNTTVNPTSGAGTGGGVTFTNPNAVAIIEALGLLTIAGIDKLTVNSVPTDTLPEAVTRPSNLTNNMLWIDNNETPKVVKLFTDGEDIIVGKPRTYRTLRPVTDDVPQSYWQSPNISSIDYNGRSFVTNNLYGTIKVLEYINGNLVEVYSSGETTWDTNLFKLGGRLYMYSAHNYDGISTIVREFIVSPSEGTPISSTTIDTLPFDLTRAMAYTTMFEQNGIMYIVARTNFGGGGWSRGTTLYSFDGTSLSVIQTINVGETSNNVDELIRYDGKYYIFTWDGNSTSYLKMYEVTTAGFMFVKDVVQQIPRAKSLLRNGKIYVYVDAGVFKALDSSFNIIPNDTIVSHENINIGWLDPSNGYIYTVSHVVGSNIYTLYIYDGYETIEKVSTIDSLGSRMGLSKTFLLDNEPYMYTTRADNTSGGKLYKLEY